MHSVFSRLAAISLCLVVGIGIVDSIVVQTPLTEAIIAAEPVPTVVVEKQEEPKGRWTLLATGDVMLSRYVKKIIDDNSVDYPFDHIRSIVQKADIAFANLENPVGYGAEIPYEGFEFRAEPETLLGLTNAGFDILSLANNHQSDNGRENIVTTIGFLKQAGFSVMGAGSNETEARTPAVIRVNNMRVAFLAYGDPRFSNQVHFADDTRPGIARAEAEAMKEDVAKAREHADVVIISLHAGTEYRSTPDRTQRELLDAAADAGADMVLGHHPHVIQPLEKRGNTWMIGSLGNLVFDQDHTDSVMRGMMLRFTFEGTTVVQIEPIPVVIKNHAQPHLATGDQKELALEALELDALVSASGSNIEMGDL